MSRDRFEQSAGGEYDPNEIITSSQDDHGHSTNFRTHVPKPWYAQMMMYINSDDWPEYRQVQDIVRDALYHRLHWMSEQKNREQFPGIRQAILRARHQRRLRANMENTIAWAEFSTEIDRVLAEKIAAQQWEGALEWCAEFKGELDDVEEPFRSKMLRQITSWEMRARDHF